MKGEEPEIVHTLTINIYSIKEEWQKGFCYLEFRLAFLWGRYKIKSVKYANEVFFYKIKLNLKSRLGEEQESGKLGNR